MSGVGLAGRDRLGTTRAHESSSAEAPAAALNCQYAYFSAQSCLIGGPLSATAIAPDRKKPPTRSGLKSREETPEKGSGTATPSPSRTAGVILCTAPSKLAGASASVFCRHSAGSVHFRTRRCARRFFARLFSSASPINEVGGRRDRSKIIFGTTLARSPQTKGPERMLRPHR